MQALRGIGELAHGTRAFFTKGLRAIGKGKMRLGLCLCRDNGYGDRATAMLEDAGVPPNWQDIPSDDSYPLGTEPMPPAPVFEGPDPVTGWLYDGSQWRDYIPSGEFAGYTPSSRANAGQV